MKILLIKRDKIGDLLLTTPLIAHLRHILPQAEIHLLANDYNAWVVSGNPHLSRLWVYPRVRSAGRMDLGAALRQGLMLWKLRRQNFDAVIAAGGEESHRAIKRAAWLGRKRSIGYCSDPGLCRLLTDPLPVPEGHEARRMMGLLAPLGLPQPDELPPPLLIPPEEALAQGRAWLHEQGLLPGGYVVLGLGARKAKRQPDARQILHLVRHLRKAHGLASVFVWTPGASDNPLYPGDDAVAQPVLDAAPAGLHPFRGPLMPALGLVWHARASVFPDSGLMHLAAASPGGVLGLFANRRDSTSPEQWGPLGPRARWLESEDTVAGLDDAVLTSELDALISE